MNVLRFAHPLFLQALWGALILAAFYWYAFRQREILLKKFGQIELLKKMMAGFSKKRRTLKAVLNVFAYIALVIACAGPQIGTRMENVKREGQDIIVALDVSLSMQAEDIKPNRLEKAKYEINKLIDILQGDRIGLVAFAGIAHVQMPLTLDYSAARLFLRMMDTHLIPQPGTAIGDAIKTATKAFNQKDRKHKVLILITDGEEHEGNPVKEAQAAAEQGVIIYTIGLGSLQGVPIPLFDHNGNRTGFKKDRQGNVVTTKLDAEILEKIAFAANGKYYISTNGETELQDIYKAVGKLEKKSLASKVFSQYEDRYQIFVALGLILILMSIMIPESRKVFLRTIS